MMGCSPEKRKDECKRLGRLVEEPPAAEGLIARVDNLTQIWMIGQTWSLGWRRDRTKDHLRDPSCCYGDEQADRCGETGISIKHYVICLM